MSNFRGRRVLLNRILNGTSLPEGYEKDKVVAQLQQRIATYEALDKFGRQLNFVIQELERRKEKLLLTISEGHLSESARKVASAALMAIDELTATCMIYANKLKTGKLKDNLELDAKIAMKQQAISDLRMEATNLQRQQRNSQGTDNPELANKISELQIEIAQLKKEMSELKNQRSGVLTAESVRESSDEFMTLTKDICQKWGKDQIDLFKHRPYSQEHGKALDATVNKIKLLALSALRVCYEATEDVDTKKNVDKYVVEFIHQRAPFGRRVVFSVSAGLQTLFGALGNAAGLCSFHTLSTVLLTVSDGCKEICSKLSNTDKPVSEVVRSSMADCGRNIRKSLAGMVQSCRIASRTVTGVISWIRHR